MKHIALFLATAFSLLSPAALRADALTDLRAKLAGLKPAGSFSARIDIRSSGTNDDEGTATHDERVAVIDATLDTAGIRLQWNSAELEKARRERAEQARNPDSPKSGGLAELSAMNAAALLDRAPSLLLRLEGATLIESRADTYQGKPVTLLILTPRNSLSAKDKKRIKKYEDTLKLWVDAQGWPLGLQSKTHLKASMFLISITDDNNESEVFAHTADRLYVVTETEDSSGSWLGQHGGNHKTTKVTPQG